MRFALVAIVTIAWSLAVLRWSISRRQSPWRKRVMIVSVIGILAAAASIAGDLHSIWLRFHAPASNIAIDVRDMGQWWQLSYRRGPRAFITANEIHVPAGVLVNVTWKGPPFMAWTGRDFLPHDMGDFYFVADNVGMDDMRVLRLWPPSRRHLRIVADSPTTFARWFDNESSPAKPHDGADVFVTSGCSYCHVIRGVSESTWKTAPELTHFASRRTIANTGLPNERGFLTGWIVNSRALKSGSEMPRNAVDPAVLRQLTVYLESLR